MIKSINLINYKIFRNTTITFNEKINILIGDNGSGKSSLLWIISCVLNGSYSQIEKEGIESLFNIEAVQEFLNNKSQQLNLKDLPFIEVELFLEDIGDNNFYINGKRNSSGIVSNGLKLLITPNEAHSQEIEETLKYSEEFPFEYYKVEFFTFSGEAYNSYNKKHNIKYEMIDTSLINTKYSIKKFVNRLYESQSDKNKRQKINHEFRKLNNDFSKTLYELSYLNKTNEYKIVIDSVRESKFTNSITAQKDNISLHNLGQGENIMLSVSTTMKDYEDPLNLILIEEPENHLSYLNTKKLIKMIDSTLVNQLIISTHDNMIASRLGLENIILMNNKKQSSFNNLDNDTSLFFKKAPNSNLLNFILANKVILVEGDAEYILLEEFYHKTSNYYPYEENVTIISCGGITFKRYLEVGKLLDKKVLVITDNDSNYEDNINEKYKNFKNANTLIKAPENNDNYTFEVELYNNNKDFFEENFKSSTMKNGILEFMKKNKTESAMRLLIKISNEGFGDFKIPEYIKEGIDWIRN